MIIQHIGHAEFLLETAGGMRIVTDPYDESTGYPVRRLKADAALVSHGHHDHNAVETLEDLQLGGLQLIQKKNGFRFGMDSVLLANGTSCGFADQAGLSPIPDESYLRPDLIVTDAIYIPEKTVLLEMAEKAGCRTLNGLGMMLYQGAAAFKMWTGKDMPVEIVKEVI